MIEVKKLRKGYYILHKNEPYIVKNAQIVVTSTHSHTKMKLEVQGLFNRINETFTLPPHARVEDIDIIRKRAQVISKLPDKIQIMDLETYETLDAISDEDLEINEGDEVTFIDFKGNRKIIEKR